MYLSPGDSTYCFVALSLSLVAFCCCSVTSNSLCLVGLQHAKLPYPSLFPRVCSNSCPLNRWCHPISSSSVTPFSCCLQSFPASGSFPMSRFFASVAKVLELQLQHQSFQWIFRLISFRMDRFDLLAVQGTLKSSPTPQLKSINSSELSFLYDPTLTSIHDYWKNHHSFD